MSETEQEQVEPAEPAAHEPEQDEQGGAESPSEDDEAAEAAEAEEEPEAAEQGDDEPEAAVTDVEIEKATKKLEAEATRHANRISEIMGEAAQALLPCELCAPITPGFRFPVPVMGDALERVRIAIGLPDLSNYREAKDARTCDDCDGLGKVLTGSHVPTRDVKDCSRCKGAGWLQVGSQPENGNVTGPLAAVAPPEQQATVVDDSSDPWGRDYTHPDFWVPPDKAAIRERMRSGAGA